jgi:hypothetical protein
MKMFWSLDDALSSPCASGRDPDFSAAALILHLSSYFLALVRKPIPTPRRLHSLFPTGRVYLRQALQRTRPLTQAHQGGELLNVGEGLANGMEPTMEAETFDFRFCGPLEAALVVDAPEFEFLDEH